MKPLLRFAISGGVLAAGVFAIGMLAPQRLNSQYASPVNVMNSKAAPALIRDTDNPARTPWLTNLSVPTTGSCSAVNDNSVPAGKTLIVDYVTAKISMAPGSKPILYFYQQALDHSGQVEQDFPMTFAGVFLSSDTYVIAQPLKVYVPSLYGLQWGVCTSDGGFSSGGHIVVSGYLIDN